MNTLELSRSEAEVQPAVFNERNTRRGSRGSRWLAYGLLIFVAILMLFPFLWLVSSSLKAQLDIFAYPPKWIPDPIVWQNYVDAMTFRPFGLYLRNSLAIAALNVIAVVLTSSFCAYGFARIRFWGRDVWFSIVIATLLLPNIVTLVPQFIIFTRLGWVNTILPLTVPLFFGGGAFNVFLFRQFFRTIPEELADAARIDGCSEFGIYWRIMLPLSRPALITVGIFTFLASWNDLIGPLVYLRSPDTYTVAIGLAQFRGAMTTRWDLQMAAATVMILPVVILFFFAQRYFIKGIVMTGLKG
jgi:ABC-type glycerol-3-phosphate transport system permease component